MRMAAALLSLALGVACSRSSGDLNHPSKEIDCGGVTCPLATSQCCIGNLGELYCKAGSCSEPVTCTGHAECGSDYCCDVVDSVVQAACTPASECLSIRCQGSGDCPPSAPRCVWCLDVWAGRCTDQPPPDPNVPPDGGCQ
jgi:hypothetical protein